MHSAILILIRGGIKMDYIKMDYIIIDLPVCILEPNRWQYIQHSKVYTDYSVRNNHDTRHGVVTALHYPTQHTLHLQLLRYNSYGHYDLTTRTTLPIQDKVVYVVVFP